MSCSGRMEVGRIGSYRTTGLACKYYPCAWAACEPPTGLGRRKKANLCGGQTGQHCHAAAARRRDASARTGQEELACRYSPLCVGSAPGTERRETSSASGQHGGLSHLPTPNISHRFCSSARLQKGRVFSSSLKSTVLSCKVRRGSRHLGNVDRHRCLATHRRTDGIAKH